MFPFFNNGYPLFSPFSIPKTFIPQVSDLVSRIYKVSGSLRENLDAFGKYRHHWYWYIFVDHYFVDEHTDNSYYLPVRNRNTMHALSGSMHSDHRLLTHSFFLLLTLTVAILLSLKSCHWTPSYQAVTSHRDLGRLTILLSGPAKTSLRSASHLLSISIFPLPFFMSSKTGNNITPLLY